jgi:purine catabolism regulator
VVVADVFALDSFREAGIEVVAGREGLERDVRWVHSGEIPDIASFLGGGELLLTAGTGIGQDPADQKAYMERLIEAGASAIVLEFGKAFDTVPEAMRSTAEAHGFPMAVLHGLVPFAEVTRTVHGWIIRRGDELRERVQLIAEEFNELLLSGAGVPQVVHKLHTVTGKPTFLEDAAHQLVEYAGLDADLDPIIADWDTHSRRGHHRAVSDAHSPVLEEERATCAFAPVMLGGEVWGRLHVIRTDAAVDDLDRLAVVRASTAVGLALLNRHHDARLAERARADFLAETARRAPADPDSFLRQAMSLGADFRGCKLVAICAETGEEDDERVLEAARAAAEQRSVPALSSTNGPAVQLLIGVPAAQDPRRAALDIAQSLVQADERIDVVSVSRPADVAQLPRAFEETQECLRFGRVSTSSSVVVEYSSLGLHILLANLCDRHELSTFVEAELGPLLQHDARGRSRLLPTLEALLANNNNRAEAARALHVERRSLYYRIGRIEKVLGKKLDDYDTQLGLGVAVRALNLIEDRVHAIPTAARDEPRRKRRGAVVGS